MVWVNLANDYDETQALLLQLKPGMGQVPDQFKRDRQQIRFVIAFPNSPNDR